MTDSSSLGSEPSPGSRTEAGTRSIKRIAVSQDSETGVQNIRHRYFHIRYLSARSYESKEANDLSQDYIAFQDDGERLVFAICDGVSQSYFGNIAAQFLGEHLVDWLWRDFPWNSRGLDKSKLTDLLVSYLNNQTTEAEAKVQQQAIPSDLPTLMQHALERKREYGSETVFACGSIELPNPQNPHGAIFLAWMGNTELQILATNENETENNLIKTTWDDKLRWSTKRGVVGGKPEIYLSSAEGIGRVVAYTDGIGSYGEKITDATDAELAQEVERLCAHPKSDDVSFIEIDLGPRWWRISEKGLSIPNIVSIELKGQQFRAEWEPVTDANHYLADLRREGLDVDRKPMRTDVPSWEKDIEKFGGKLEFVVQAVDKDGAFGPKARVALLVTNRQESQTLWAPVAALGRSRLNDTTLVAILAIAMAVCGLVAGLILGIVFASSTLPASVPIPVEVTATPGVPASILSPDLESVKPTVTSVPTSTPTLVPPTATSTQVPPTATPRPTQTPLPPTRTPTPTIEIIKPPLTP